MRTRDVGILGAGPYGLSVAAHLKSIRGLDVCVFGKPMSFWSEQMPAGMLLRSAYSASHLSDPAKSLNLETYEKARGAALNRPIPLNDFVDYGLWFQAKAVSEIDQRRIICIDSISDGFRVLLDDETECCFRRLIVAGGIGFFSRIPRQFAHLSQPFVIHASQLQNPRLFSNKVVAVIGGGQSALESAALLCENGSNVEIIARKERLHFLGWSRRIHKLGAIAKLVYAPTDVGPAGISRLVAAPKLYRSLLPRVMQDRLRDFCRRPAGAYWLRDRLEPVTVTTSRTVTSAVSMGSRIRLKLDNGEERLVDHVVLGTGYEIDISKYPFLSQNLCRSIQTRGGFPRLDVTFASSIPGLYFVGAPSAWSFGPLMFFVAGADFAARTIARDVANRGLH